METWFKCYTVTKSYNFYNDVKSFYDNCLGYMDSVRQDVFLRFLYFANGVEFDG
ncbi:MAG: hypothetical protein SNJ70_01685 [Armatimonadota bacterium]